MIRKLNLHLIKLNSRRKVHIVYWSKFCSKKVFYICICLSNLSCVNFFFSFFPFKIMYHSIEVMHSTFACPPSPNVMIEQFFLYTKNELLSYCTFILTFNFRIHFFKNFKRWWNFWYTWCSYTNTYTHVFTVHTYSNTFLYRKKEIGCTISFLRSTF